MRGGGYDLLSREELIALLEKRDREKKLGLVWERDEIEADLAVDANFIAATLVPELSDKPAPWRNLVIEGDNYDALRWLRMTMAGRIKCIYVDPPYNTGNKDWVYNDHYVSADDRWRHSTWLEFLYRRFTLARDLLTEDGVILVSINDENRAKLELMLDEALPGMRIGSLVWRNRTGSNADQLAFMSPDHEHVLVFANSGFQFGGTAKTYELYFNPDDDPRGDWTSGDLTLGFDRTQRPNLYYPLRDPETDTWYPCNPDGVWRYASRARLKEGQSVQTKTMEEFLADGRILFPKDHRVEQWHSKQTLIESIKQRDVPVRGRSITLWRDMPDLDFWVGKKVGFGTPRFKRFKSELRNLAQPLSSWIVSRSEAEKLDQNQNTIQTGTNDEGAKAIKAVFAGKAFNYAKPPSLIRGLIQQSTSPGDTVLDFFAGSATTAQAVMELNAEDGGDRRFIMVSSAERTADEPDKNLCRDVAAERIRRLNASEDEAYADLAAEFAYLRCREIDFTDLDYHDGLTPGEAWSALEALHGLPLMPHDPNRKWQAHEGEDVILVQVDKFAADLTPYLQALAARRANVFVYAWAPGQVREAIGRVDFEIHPVRDTLVRRFQQ
jgi:adenine-specific DNA-methyltransferase